MAKIRKDLIGSVLVENPAGGDPIVLVAGDKVPDGITLGDHVLAKKSDAGSSQAGQGGADGASGAAGASDPAGGPTGSEDEGSVPVPPQSGRGSGDPAWHAYAKAATAKAGLSIEIPADAKRGDIIEALKGAGIPVE